MSCLPSRLMISASTVSNCALDAHLPRVFTQAMAKLPSELVLQVVRAPAADFSCGLHAPTDGCTQRAMKALPTSCWLSVKNLAACGNHTQP